MDWSLHHIFGSLDEEEWHGNLKDNVIQSENKISKEETTALNTW